MYGLLDTGLGSSDAVKMAGRINESQEIPSNERLRKLQAPT